MNLRSIPRYGVRSVPGDEQEIVAAFRRGEAIEGPAIGEFESQFAQYFGVAHAQSASYGRMALYYILRALELPEGTEILFPALTFWAVPEIARRAGFRPVFVDVDPATFNLKTSDIESRISEHTRVIVPTHLYGQPCDMTAVMRIAERHNLIVIEDCAQAAGARHRGRLVGTFGDASFFSFQMLKGLNTYGGGMALTNERLLFGQLSRRADAEPLQTTGELIKRFLTGIGARSTISPKWFTFWGYPILATASLAGDRDLSTYIWERIRPLDPFPNSYRRRYSNAQAILGLRALARLDDFNQHSRTHAQRYREGLGDCRALQLPFVIPESEHVYYQFCVYASDPSLVRRRAIRRGVDFETTHVDVCSSLPLFEEFAADCPGATATEKALQLPVYSRLRSSDVDRVLDVVRKVTFDLAPLTDSSQSLSSCAPEVLESQRVKVG